ncbi:Gfo/Idh/MocA family protein [Kitasatospora sp. NPDC058965]|uniref:Gfo/Idh/MocA family protein n=1 Tax=Kitasatospora sp. NPDC058965 TaxID=3346682 RepID=UPI003675342F
MSGPLRVGLIGLGVMGRHHARVLRGLDGVRLVGVVDPAGDPDGAVHGTPVHAEPAGLLARGLDYAVVACPTGAHEEVGLALAAHGVPALIEKPLGGSAAAAGRLVRAFEERRLLAAVGHVERFQPVLKELRARLPELGVLSQVLTERQAPLGGRAARTGVVQDLATHDLDLTRWLTGREYAWLAARTVRRPGAAVEGAAAVLGELADGTLVSHQVGRLGPVRRRTVVVTGEHGRLAADMLAGTLLRQGPGVEQLLRPPAAPDALTAQHREFAAAVAGRGGRVVALREGLRAVELAESVLARATRSDGVTV